MIRPSDRRLAYLLVRLRIFTVIRPFFGRSHVAIRPRRGSRFIFDWMRRRQSRDGLHHAPMCPGNEWSGQELVWFPCNCGAAAEARAKAEAHSEGNADV